MLISDLSVENEWQNWIIWNGQNKAEEDVAKYI